MKLFNEAKLFLGRLAAKTYMDDAEEIVRFGENLSPNMRALRLSMQIADILLSMGVAVSDVVSMALDVTDRYCKRKVQVDISSSVLTFSQDRGNENEPLTLVHTSVTRTTNNMTVQSVQELVDDISHSRMTLDKAEERLEYIRNNQKKYPIWLTTLGSAMISSGVGALLSGSMIIITITFFIGGFVAFIMRLMSHNRVPTFFMQIGATILITLTASGVQWLSDASIFPVLDNVNTSLIIIGGIVMLVAGLTIVGAVQDAIDEFYTTANSRILKVVMLTAGIVAGLTIGLFISKKLGIELFIDTERPLYYQIGWQYLGAFLIAAGFSLSMQSNFTGIILAGMLGLTSWYIYATMLSDLGSIAASGLAAAISGAIATLTSRAWHVPTTSLITAGIIPLVPGLALFNGMMQIVENTNSNGSIDEGTLTLWMALTIAMVVAAGASFGNLIARPVDRTLVRARNSLPRQSPGS